jgi:uncharacterized protein DUF6433
MRSLGDVLSGIKQCKDDRERVKFLQDLGPKYKPSVMTYLKHMFDPKIEFDLPEGLPSDVKRVDSDPSVLVRESRKLYLYTKGGYPNLRPAKREKLFSELLEACDDADTELIAGVKDKKCPYEGVTKKLVLKAFPGLF